MKTLAIANETPVCPLRGARVQKAWKPCQGRRDGAPVARRHRERIIANGGLFDIALSDTEMKQIDAVDKNQRLGADPDTFTF